MHEILPFGAEFAEAPHLEAIELPEYNPETQTSLNFCNAVYTDTYCTTCRPSGNPDYWNCWADSCDSDEDCV